MTCELCTRTYNHLGRARAHRSAGLLQLQSKSSPFVFNDSHYFVGVSALNWTEPTGFEKELLPEVCSGHFSK
jgi:hypothetical protein